MGITSEIGARAERAAVEYLRGEGFVIMDTNWRSGRYELDIVASKGETIHFVEVKCRKDGGVTLPEEAMTAKKGGFLLKAANDYMAQHAIEAECQIDLVAVDGLEDGSFSIRYVPQAYVPHW